MNVMRMNISVPLELRRRMEEAERRRPKGWNWSRLASEAIAQAIEEWLVVEAVEAVARAAEEMSSLRLPGADCRP